MTTFAFLGNTLFLTILVSMLSNTFSTIVSNATAEIEFRQAVLTLEGVKSDAIFAYQPPFNILAMLIFVPMRFLVSPRWFHKIHVATVRFINLPLLLIIAVAERRSLWPIDAAETDPTSDPRQVYRPSFWEKWRITTHSDIQAVFETAPPDSVLEDITADDDLTTDLIRKQFQRHNTADESQLRSMQQRHNSQSSHTDSQRGNGDHPSIPAHQDSRGGLQPPAKSVNRRDSMAVLSGMLPSLRDSMSRGDSSDDISDRLDVLEDGLERIESLLTKLAGSKAGSAQGDIASEESEEELEDAAKTGTLRDLDKTASEQ
jgi:hypothetical protein